MISLSILPTSALIKFLLQSVKVERKIIVWGLFEMCSHQKFTVHVQSQMLQVEGRVISWICRLHSDRKFELLSLACTLFQRVPGGSGCGLPTPALRAAQPSWIRQSALSSRVLPSCFVVPFLPDLNVHGFFGQFLREGDKCSRVIFVVFQKLHPFFCVFKLKT